MVSQEIQEILKRAGTWDSYKEHHQLDEELNIDLSPYYNSAVKALNDSIDWGGGGGEMVYYAYTSQYGEYDPGEGEDPSESEQFKRWLPLYLKSLIDNAEDRILYSATTQAGKMIVWRVIVAPADWIQKGIFERSLGVFWSWSEGSAEAHWGSFEKSGIVEYLITSSVSLKDVEWDVTLATNADLTQEEEREIRVREGTPMPVLGVVASRRGVRTRPDDPIAKTQRLNVNHLAGKYFPA